MSIIISGIRIPPDHTEKQAFERACDMCGIKPDSIKGIGLHKLSIDARRGKVEKVCAVKIDLFCRDTERRIADNVSCVSFVEQTDFSLEIGAERIKNRPVVVGFGPAGMFAALTLARYGFRPVCIEQGADVDSRVEAVNRFFSSGILDERSNIQFGAGGAGTFSDGKLTTRINDPLCGEVINTFCEFGAPEDIRYRAKPHLGTDKLREIVKGITAEIIRLGGEVRFATRLTGLETEGSRIMAAVTDGGRIETGQIVLAIGHSSRDTFSMLHEHSVALVAKPFSIGARIEHLQSDIDRSMYHQYAACPELPSAEYACSHRQGDRAVYTFCMCPGGTVVAASSEIGGVCTNGMSDYKRNGKNANAAVVVSVSEKDFGSDPFAAIEYQRSLERKAFEIAGKNYSAPACDVGSFLAGRAGLNLKRVEPSYPLGVKACDLELLFGRPTAEMMRLGIRRFAEHVPCFIKDGVLTAPETRTSSPVRIIRDDSRQSIGLVGLYPCGEGAGYAGGIMSAAVDGLKTAAEIVNKYHYIDG